jgi:FKBP-type peptidyl-prolyl cis-trans isomerase 2
VQQVQKEDSRQSDQRGHTMAHAGEFIEIHFTGKVKDTGQVFDTTVESVAHEQGLEHHHGKMLPVVICLGEKHVLPALEKNLIDKAPGKYSFEVGVMDAFGKKDAKLMRLIPMKLFHKEQINPSPGMPVTVDQMQGVVRAVSGGRVIVDFNHPLAGQDLIYDVEILRTVTDPKIQVEGLLRLRQLPTTHVEITDNKAIVHVNLPLPPEMAKPIEEEIVKCCKLAAVSFVEDKKDPKDKKDIADAV